jgi:hypothetical protein
LGESEGERELRRLTEFIEARGGRITARELQRSNSRKYRNVEEAEAALRALADSGAADWQEGDTPARGGHRQRWLVLRPTHDTSDTRHDDGDDPEDQPSDTRSDTRQGRCEFPEENERVSEVSGVGQETEPAADGPTPPERVSDANGECRTDPEKGGPWYAPGHEGLETPFDGEAKQQ